MPKSFTVIKWNGERQEFLPEKLVSSLRRSGASEVIARKIVAHVENGMHEDMKTSDIYHLAFEFLKQHHIGLAGRYNLKKAILRLGPSGYPFERFIGKVWDRLGYETRVSVLVPGKCIEHEVDVLAENAKEVLMIECKYHNFHDTKNDVKTVLYVKARMDDLRARFEEEGNKRKFRGILLTNTQLSTSALRYAQCSGLEVIAWSYPAGHGLAQIIDEVGLHPITSLTTLTEAEIKTLLQNGHVLCQDAPKGMHLLRLDGEKRKRVLEEAKSLIRLK